MAEENLVFNYKLILYSFQNFHFHLIQLKIVYLVLWSSQTSFSL